MKVRGFGIIFRDIKLNAGCIESKLGSEGKVDSPADGFGEILHTLEHQFNIKKKVLLKAGEERGVRYLGEAETGKKRYERQKG